jgi:hypothetical protein
MACLKIGPRSDWNVVQHMVDDNPGLLFQDQVQVFEFGYRKAYGFTQFFKGELHVIKIPCIDICIAEFVHRYVFQSVIHGITVRRPTILEPISKLIFSVYTSLSPFSNAHLLRVNCAFRKALASSKRKISNFEIGSNKIALYF